MLHCAIGHWGALSHENTISSLGWVKTYQEAAFGRFLGVVEDMREGRRPIERGALVVAGAVYPQDKKLRAWFLTKLRTPDNAMAIAAVFALTPHLDLDEDLADRFTLECLKRPRTDPNDAVRVALQVGLSIWVTSKGSGRCTACGKTPS